jgi:arylsulfatase A
MLRLFSTAAILAVTLATAAPEKPNVIVIMADDLGYGDLSCYGANTFKTPHIDQLARGGQLFTSGYCSASTCTSGTWSADVAHCASSSHECTPPSRVP